MVWCAAFFPWEDSVHGRRLICPHSGESCIAETLAGIIFLNLNVAYNTDTCAGSFTSIKSNVLFVASDSEGLRGTSDRCLDIIRRNVINEGSGLKP